MRIEGADTFSADGMYRWTLTRTWDVNRPRLCMSMLNPSKAGAIENDPTIIRVMGFAMHWNFGSVEVINLCAAVTTNPDRLMHFADAVGYANMAYWVKAMRNADAVCCAWGAVPKFIRQHYWREPISDLILTTHGKHLQCIGLTKDQHPCHPLYMPKASEMRPWQFNAAWWESNQ